MGKYEPLRQHLTGLRDASVRMSFRQIEDILGFRLPASARQYPPWWSNSDGTHTQSAAWLGAGWKTAQVDIPAEKVSFVRGAEQRVTASSPAIKGFGEGTAAFVGATLKIPVERLTPAALNLVERYAKEADGDIVAAVARALHEAAKARIRTVLDEIARTAPKIEGDFDVVAMIREDRDSR